MIDESNVQSEMKNSSFCELSKCGERGRQDIRHATQGWAWPNEVCCIHGAGGVSLDVGGSSAEDSLLVLSSSGEKSQAIKFTL